MLQIKTYLKRLRNPTVVLSIVSQVVILLSVLDIDVDTETLNGLIAGVLSILVTLGIMSNPDSTKKTYGDDIIYCETCKKETIHAKVAGEMVCLDCETHIK